MSEHSRWLAAGATVFACVICLLAWLHMQDSVVAARDAVDNLRHMQQLQASIVELRSHNANAHLAGEQPMESSSSWVEYGKAAGINENHITEISRLPVQPIKGTAYSSDQVFLRLKDVSAQQVIELLVACRSAGIGYSPLSVHFESKRGSQATPELWSVALVLTRLLYTAKTSE